MRAPLSALRSTSFCEYSLITSLLKFRCRPAKPRRIKNPAAACEPVRGLVCLSPAALVRRWRTPARLAPAKEQQRGQGEQERAARTQARGAGLVQCCPG